MTSSVTACWMQAARWTCAWNRSTGVDYSDPVASLRDLATSAGWVRPTWTNSRGSNTLTGQDRIDGAVALAHRLVDKDYSDRPVQLSALPVLHLERIGCGFVQPALGAVDLLSLCIKDGQPIAGSPSPSP